MALLTATTVPSFKTPLKTQEKLPFPTMDSSLNPPVALSSSSYVNICALLILNSSIEELFSFGLVVAEHLQFLSLYLTYKTADIDTTQTMKKAGTGITEQLEKHAGEEQAVQLYSHTKSDVMKDNDCYKACKDENLVNCKDPFADPFHSNLEDME
ncbi:hypothetical protein Lal_00009878 [Lupinus albus]|nr:hypothetical protein Lal_00009878 [Lupinus albus]